MYSLLCEHEQIESVQLMPGGQIAVLCSDGNEEETPSYSVRIFQLTRRRWKEATCGHSIDGSDNLGAPDAMLYEHPITEVHFAQATDGVIDLEAGDIVSRLTLLDGKGGSKVIEWVAPEGTPKPKKKAAVSKGTFTPVCVHNKCAEVFKDDSDADLPELWDFDGRLIGISETNVILLD